MNSTRGKPINKARRVASNHRKMLVGLDKRCTNPLCCDFCKLPHVPCQGSDTRMTEEYTDLMVKVIHNNFRAIAGSHGPSGCALVRGGIGHPTPECASAGGVIKSPSQEETQVAVKNSTA